MDPSNPVSQFTRDYPFVLPMLTTIFSVWIGRRWATQELKKNARNIFFEDIKALRSKVGLVITSNLESKNADVINIRTWLQAIDTDLDAISNKYLDLLGPEDKRKSNQNSLTSGK